MVRGRLPQPAKRQNPSDTGCSDNPRSELVSHGCNALLVDCITRGGFLAGSAPRVADCAPRVAARIGHAWLGSAPRVAGS